jgi:hypothetical protein
MPTWIDHTINIKQPKDIYLLLIKDKDDEIIAEIPILINDVQKFKAHLISNIPQMVGQISSIFYQVCYKAIEAHETNEEQRAGVFVGYLIHE